MQTAPDQRTGVQTPKFSPLVAVFFFRSPAGFWVNVKTRRMPEQSYQVHAERRS